MRDGSRLVPGWSFVGMPLSVSRYIHTDTHTHIYVYIYKHIHTYIFTCNRFYRSSWHISVPKLMKNEILHIYYSVIREFTSEVPQQ